MSEEPVGISEDLGAVAGGVSALRELAADPEKADDDARIYDFSIRWGALMSGRLLRLEHYHRQGALSQEHARRYRELRRELSETKPLIERFGLTRPAVPLDDEEEPRKE